MTRTAKKGRAAQMSKKKTATGNAIAGGGLDGLKAMISRAGERKRGPAPVDEWEPEFSGDLDMEILRDGSWYYMGTPIARQSLVDLFSTVLRKDEDGATYLVTPVEKYRISVADAAFLAVEMNVHEEDGNPVLTFRTNVGDVVEADREHPLRFERDEENDGIRPYIRVRGRLEALLTRPVMYELMEHAHEMELDGDRVVAVESKGKVFPVMAEIDLKRQLASN
jgi:hypothetical protein